MFKIWLIFVIATFSLASGRHKPEGCLLQPENNWINKIRKEPQGYQGINSRIAGGSEAAAGQFPWHVHMNLYDDIGVKICGGALIKPKWVLTSGLCLICTSSAILYLGIIDRLSFNVPWITHVTDYNHFIIHEGFDFINNPQNNADNIGLVFLQNGGEHLLDIPNVAIIDLPVNHGNVDFLNWDATAAGFGATEDPQTYSSAVLKYINMTVISNQQCNATYNGTIDANKICTDAAGGRSTCHGDFGAPLSTSIDDSYVIIGVGSTRYIGGCQVGNPAVFTRVTSYLDWIEEKIRDEPSDSTDCVCDCICHTCPSTDTRKIEL